MTVKRAQRQLKTANKQQQQR